jgi:hypothetical protein
MASPRISPPGTFINQLVHATFDEDFRLIRNTQSQYRTTEEKEEDKRHAEYVKEEERLRALEDQEEKKLADLMLELEQQRKKLGDLGSVDDRRSMVWTLSINSFWPWPLDRHPYSPQILAF